MQTIFLSSLVTNAIIFFTCFIAMIITFVVIDLGRVRKYHLLNEKAKKELEFIQLQKELNTLTFSLLRSQMNPHFIFNALSTIKNYIYLNDKINASYYLDQFSDLIRKTLDYSSKSFINLEEEIEYLQLYIDIEKARFGKELNATINLSTDTDIKEISIPPMLIQPYVENSIKHGLMHVTGEKKLIVNVGITADKQYAKIEIIDFGIGRERSAKINKDRNNHNPFAIKANEKMIDLVNKLYKKEAKVEIIDRYDKNGLPEGTKVSLYIPLT